MAPGLRDGTPVVVVGRIAKALLQWTAEWMRTFPSSLAASGHTLHGTPISPLKPTPTAPQVDPAVLIPSTLAFTAICLAPFLTMFYVFFHPLARHSENPSVSPPLFAASVQASLLPPPPVVPRVSRVVQVLLNLRTEP
ncbi:hypothetical protein LshimejAT787_0705100 [Lyophyllum shimeji]|uniref:Uncharacterized protein n=1 Tax=Lyophyllum shimeji TaxID=47721 RepID=A0A9P3UQB4_LYOSH|nr:hypothetical protein LshimejAT787_0705100 [Lyophyllum shimeji]